MSKKNVLPQVKLILDHAIVEAKAFGETQLRPQHVLLSILIDGNNEAIEVLDKMGFDNLSMYDLVSDFIRKHDINPRVSPTSKKLQNSSELLTVLKTLDKECESLGGSTIGVEHLMLAVMGLKSPVISMLNSMDLTYMNFKETLKIMKEDNRHGGGEDDFDGDEDRNIPSRPKKKGGETSKTPVLDNFCRDVSKAVEKGEIDKVIGRSVEIKRLAQILSRRKKNNPILIGEPGVGKCILGNSYICLRNDVTNDIFKISIDDFLHTLPNSK